jgi:hypothetical protein
VTEEHTYIGGTDTVLPDIDKALGRAIDGLDDLSAAIKRHVEAGVPFNVAERLLYTYPLAVEARKLGTMIFHRLYSSQPTADDTDYDTPF